MSKLSIKVQIANRHYPMNIDPAEEESVRKAVKLIEDKLKDFEKRYAVKDKQDVLAMCILQFVHELIDVQDKQQNNVESSQLEKHLSRLESILSD